MCACSKRSFCTSFVRHSGSHQRSLQAAEKPSCVTTSDRLEELFVVDRGQHVGVVAPLLVALHQRVDCLEVFSRCCQLACVLRSHIVIRLGLDDVDFVNLVHPQKEVWVELTAKASSSTLAVRVSDREE